MQPVLMQMVGYSKQFLSAEDAVISDELNHASIIDGVDYQKRKDIDTRIMI